MNGDPFDNNEHLPPWLRDAPLPPPPARQSPPSRSEPPTAPAPPPDNADGLPDWLKDFDSSRTREPAAQPAELPAWLRSEPDEPAAPPAAENELPAWLQEADTSSAATGSHEQELPAWLRQDTAEPASAAQPGADVSPGWSYEASAASAPTPPAEAPPGPPASNASELPAWLRDLPTGPTDAPGAPRPGAELDLWTDEPAAPPASPPQASFGAPDMPPGAADRPEPPAADDSGIPSWLRDISQDEIRAAMGDADAQPSLEPFSLDDIPGSPTEPGAALPSWLAGLAEDESGGGGGSWFAEIESAAPGSPAAKTGAGDVPQWLQNLESGAPDADPTTTPLASEAATAPGERDTTPESAPGVAAHSPEPPAAELPAWLRDADASQPPAGESTAELPAWLQDAGQAQPPTGKSTGEVPAWLRAEAGGLGEPAEDEPAWLKSGAPSEPPSESDMPAWLRAELPAAPLDRPPPEPPAEQPPSWLGTPAPAEPQETELPVWLRADTVEQTADDQLPDWLRTDQPATPAEPAPASSQRGQPPASADDDLPPWLRDEAGQPLPTAGAPGDSHLPEWLRGAATEPAPTPATPDQPRERSGAPEKLTPAQMDWFGEPETAETTGRAQAGESEFFGGAELPAWLRTPEAEPAAEINPADARSLDWLTRLGAIEEETVSTTTAAPKLPRPEPPTRSAAQRQALALLQQLAAEPFPQAAPEPATAPASIWQRIGIERLLYLLLLAVLLVALAVPSLAGGLQLETPPEAPGAPDLFARIDTLSENDVVLVGYEWDARRISELRPLKEAVLDQLIQKKVKLVLVSTDPQGTLLLFDLRDDLVRASYRIGGEDYILLGYKPGGELALRSLAQDFRGMLRSDFQGNDAAESSLATDVSTGQPRLTMLNDLSMILVLADDSADVQSWMEQVHRNAPQVPLSFLLPAETAPIVQPYLKQPGIYHLAGKQGALAYQQLRSGSGEPAAQIAREAGQQRIGILVFIALFVLGAVAVGAARVATGRRTAP